jgi:tetratricopeptide (TPR) repeat protein
MRALFRLFGLAIGTAFGLGWAQNPAPAGSSAGTAAGSTEAGAAAVQRVKNLGFRLNSGGSRSASASKDTATATPAPDAANPVPSNAVPAPDPPAGAGSMQLGKVKEPVSLPPDLAPLAKEGALAVADRDWPKARDIYLEMVRKAPDNALAYANLGVAEHQLGNLLAAAGNLGRSTELNPHIARNWQTLGLIHYERGDLALALSSLSRAVHEEPNEAETRLILAAVVRDYGWPEAAITELQRAVEIDPKLAAAHYNLAVTYLGMEPPKIELARRHYYAAIDLGTPASPELEAILKPSE